MLANSLPSCITTMKVEETRDFYVKHLGAKITFDCGCYVNLSLAPAITEEVKWAAAREPFLLHR